MGPIWGRQDPGGPHIGPMNFAIWVEVFSANIVCLLSNHSHLLNCHCLLSRVTRIHVHMLQVPQKLAKLVWCEWCCQFPWCFKICFNVISNEMFYILTCNIGGTKLLTIGTYESEIWWSTSIFTDIKTVPICGPIHHHVFTFHITKYCIL